jgi:hypothetical protein
MRSALDGHGHGASGVNTPTTTKISEKNVDRLLRAALTARYKIATNSGNGDRGR